MALNQNGIATGYEETKDEIFALLPNLTFTPYTFLSIQTSTKKVFKLLLPSALGRVDSSWDTSWMPGETRWKTLTQYETKLLRLFRDVQRPKPKPKPKAKARQTFLICAQTAN